MKTAINLKLLHRMKRICSRQASTSQGPQFSQLVGRKALIVISDDEYSKQMAQKMWVNLQKNGCQQVQYTIKSPFPNTKDILQGIDMARRTGVSSVIGLGSGAVVDVSKAIRLALETGSHQIQSHKFKLQDKSQFPLIAVPFTASVVPYSPVFLSMHEKDDTLVRWPCRTPEILRASPSYSPEVASLYLICSLIDICFTHSLLNLEYGNIFNRSLNEIVDDRSLLKWKEKLLSLGQICGRERTTDLDSVDILSQLCELVHVVASLKTQIQTHTQIPTTQDASSNHSDLSRRLGVDALSVSCSWPGPMESVLTVLAMANIHQKKNHFSWGSSRALKAFIKTLEESTNNQKQSVEKGLEAKVIQASTVSMEYVQSLTGLSVPDLLEICERTETWLTSSNKSKQSHTQSNPVDEAALAAVLEENVFSLEMDIEKRNNEKETDNIVVDTAAANVDIDVDLAELQLKVLRTDFLSDMISNSCSNYS
eukprot:gene5621-11344_t